MGEQPDIAERLVVSRKNTLDTSRGGGRKAPDMIVQGVRATRGKAGDQRWGK